MRETPIINITCQIQTYVNNDGAPPEGTSGRHFYTDDWCWSVGVAVGVAVVLLLLLYLEPS